GRGAEGAGGRPARGAGGLHEPDGLGTGRPPERLLPALARPDPGGGGGGHRDAGRRHRHQRGSRRGAARGGPRPGGGALAVAAGTLAPRPAPAAGPARQAGKSHLRLSLAAYSYRKYLDLKLKPKPPMTLDDFVEVAADLGVDAVEPTAYYFADTSPAYLARL